MAGCVVGLDLSLRSTGLVVLDELGQPAVAKVIAFEKLRGIERIAAITNEIMRSTEEFQVDLWAIEGYGYNSQNGNDLAELGGVVKFELHLERHRPPLLVAPSRLKKWVVGHGKAEKDQMRLAVSKRWGFEFDGPADVIDAFAVAQFGLAYLGRGQGLTKAQIETIEAVHAEERKRARESA